MAKKELIKRVLIVEDEPEIVEFLKNFLKRRDIEVFFAYQGEEALSLFEEKAPELVLLDIGLPGLSGLEVLKEIKKKNPKTYVIMVTGRADSASISKAKKLGVENYLTKPVDLAELHSLIEKYLVK